MNCAIKKQLQLSLVPFFLCGVFLCTLYQLTTGARLHEFLSMPQAGEGFGKGSTEVVEEATGETLSATHDLEPTAQTTPGMHVVRNSDITSDFTPTLAPGPPVNTITINPSSPGEAPHFKAEFPKEVFSIEDRRQGWVILHIIGMMYMFVSLAIVCDEFFVPALWVIADKLAISDDVAGATVMAAGRSAPKLFTSLIGVFIAHSNVGIGTIVGSAVFNILFVIGMCALFSREVLHLTQWPLFRDVSFYILDLILFILFFLDNVIMWWESLMLVTSYVLYIIFMKFNAQTERAFKTQLCKCRNIDKVIAVEESEKEDVPAGEDRSGGSGDEKSGKDHDDSNKNEIDADKNEEEEKRDKPLSLQWPNTRCKQVTYLLLLPIVFPLWLTVPDVRRQKSRKFFVVTFLGSILWIDVFSYLMVWWAHQVGEALGIPEGIMGLTILAAGTSIPHILTSVIVARKGKGDMAVSSSVGSNIFDITVGLPVPWLLYSLIHGSVPVTVSSSGLFCAIVLLFIMLLFFIVSIAACKWKISKGLGFTMFLLYFIFLVVSLMLQYHILVCPVSVSNRP